MKRSLILMAVTFIAVQSFAQDIEVSEFRQLETDLTANTAGTIVLDQNGEKCALIKVTTSKTDFSFDAGMIGIVKTIQKEGSIWLYVPEGVKRLSISHAGMESLLDYDLGMTVKKACTYLLKLKTSKDVVLQTVNFKVTPANVTILLESADPDSDFQKQSLTLTDGTATVRIPTGSYKYTSMASGYNVEEDLFILSASSEKNVLIEMVALAGVPAPAVVTQQSRQSPADLSASVENGTVTVNGISFNMIPVEGGPSGNFHIGETEVTQQLWETVMGANPSKIKDSRNPVENVSWNDCQEFITKLNSVTGKEFRLPTVAEWEYAAKGGSKSRGYKYSGSKSIDEVAWYKDNSGSRTHAVKTKSANELGIYDMSGNVSEWCDDWYDASHRVCRGGSWTDSDSICRVSFRFGIDPSYRDNNLGLRLVF